MFIKTMLINPPIGIINQQSEPAVLANWAGNENTPTPIMVIMTIIDI